MLAEPISLTISGTTHTLNRVEVSGRRTLYENADRSVSMRIDQIITKTKRSRWEITIEWRKLVTNPIDSTNDYDSVTYRQTVDRPEYGFVAADVFGLMSGVNTWQSSATVTALVSGQS